MTVWAERETEAVGFFFGQYAESIAVFLAHRVEPKGDCTSFSGERRELKELAGRR
jgi:hypothetical protein